MIMTAGLIFLYVVMSLRNRSLTMLAQKPFTQALPGGQSPSALHVMFTQPWVRVKTGPIAWAAVGLAGIRFDKPKVITVELAQTGRKRATIKYTGAMPFFEPGTKKLVIGH